MIEQLTTAAAVSLLNRMLLRESWACERLAPFAGRVARFEALPFALSLKIDEGGRFADAERGEPVVTVGLDLASLPLALGDPQAPLRNVSLKGDADFAQALAFVLQNLRPEPEEELSRFVGDVVAQRIVGLMRLSASYWRQLAERMLDSGAHYVVSENPMVAGRDEVEEFNAAVARLRDDVARLEKRVELQERAR
jgi:ubiquinone biosynthesis protein UbiJ